MKKIILWILAFFVTVSVAIYQRHTGPTYPVRGTAILGSKRISFRLERSYETGKDCLIKIPVSSPEIFGYILYKRYKTRDHWTKIPMSQQDNELCGSLPWQPPAGKLAYKVILGDQNEEIFLNNNDPVIIRFKGSVPSVILILHIVIMFGAMLLSTRTGIEAIQKKTKLKKWVYWTVGFLFVGGFILGPVIQKFAFGSFWTGFPFGHDLTDNKTLIAMLGWLVALFAMRRPEKGRGWVIAASVLLLAVFLIPHSLLGSELDYSQAEMVVSGKAMLSNASVRNTANVL